MSNAPFGVIVSILCVEDDPQRLCRRLASAVNNGPMHLTKVVATGLQIYPVQAEGGRGPAAQLRCDFRVRKTGSPVTDADVRDLFDRIRGFDVLDSHLIDGQGVNLGPAMVVAVAS